MASSTARLSTPLIVAKFNPEDSFQIRESRCELRYFTVTRRHSSVDNIQTPGLCLVELQSYDQKPTCYIGVLHKKAAVSSLDTRLTFLNLVKISHRSVVDLAKAISDSRQKNQLLRTTQNHSCTAAISPKLRKTIFDILLKSDGKIIKAALEAIPGNKEQSPQAMQQDDAIKLAISFAGLSAKDALDDYNLSPSLLEDNVIIHDADVPPGFDRVKADLTGHRCYRKGNEVLEIYLANRGPLEKMLGVDLIYINQTLGSSVMVQYKMLESSQTKDGNKWLFRPDRQFNKELSRMKLAEQSKKNDDYRLNPCPFYFKLVKRRIAASGAQSSIISRGHMVKLLKSPKMRGKNKGIRIDYEALGGCYLREGDFIGLVKSGYIGTHEKDTKRIAPFIERAARGERGIVYAWQRLAGRHDDE